MVTVGNIIESRMINKIDNSLEVMRSEIGTDGFSIVTFECLKYIKLYKQIYVNNVLTEFEIIGSNQLKLQGSIDFTTDIKLPIPLFFQGSLSNTKFEWEKFSNKEADKLPFIWLNSPSDERLDVYGNSETSIELWFVHTSDWKKKNSDRINESIEPLRSLVNSVTNKIDARFPTYDNFMLRNFPKLVDEQTNKLIFNGELSAVQLNMNIKFYNYFCK
jgi:hypothetical protein